MVLVGLPRAKPLSGQGCPSHEFCNSLTLDIIPLGLYVLKNIISLAQLAKIGPVLVANLFAPGVFVSQLNHSLEVSMV